MRVFSSTSTATLSSTEPTADCNVRRSDSSSPAKSACQRGQTTLASRTAVFSQKHPRVCLLTVTRRVLLLADDVDVIQEAAVPSPLTLVDDLQHSLHVLQRAQHH
jgi:hypothetical protein